MFGKKKKLIVEEHKEIIIEPSAMKIRILESEEDCTGNDIMAMSDFFSTAMRELSIDLKKHSMPPATVDFPLAEISIVNEALQTVGFLKSNQFELIPDFDSPPAEIYEKFKKGKLVLGDSKQVEGNLRAVLVDADTNVRVKDVTLKKVDKTGAGNNISQNLITQMQLRQISEQLEYLASEQTYLMEFMRNQTLIRPFLDARDDILKAQQQKERDLQLAYLRKAEDKLQTAVNAIYVDLNTIELELAAEIKKKWFLRLKRGNTDKMISRYAADWQMATKYVGVQMQVAYYLGDAETANNVLAKFKRNMNRMFEKGVVNVNKSLAIIIHENIEYNEKNMDCWYNLEKDIKPTLEMVASNGGTRNTYVITNVEGSSNE